MLNNYSEYLEPFPVRWCIHIKYSSFTPRRNQFQLLNIKNESLMSCSLIFYFHTKMDRTTFSLCQFTNININSSQMLREGYSVDLHLPNGDVIKRCKRAIDFPWGNQGTRSVFCICLKSTGLFYTAKQDLACCDNREIKTHEHAFPSAWVSSWWLRIGGKYCRW